jgi:hypothetical protein
VNFRQSNNPTPIKSRWTVAKHAGRMCQAKLASSESDSFTGRPRAAEKAAKLESYSEGQEVIFHGPAVTGRRTDGEAAERGLPRICV